MDRFHSYIILEDYDLRGNEMNGIFLAFLGTLMTFFVTVLGSAAIFCVRREVSNNLQCGFLGFAGGVMVAASVWSLLLPGIDFAEDNGQIGWLVMTAGFLLGVLVLLAADGCLNRWFERCTGGKDAEHLEYPVNTAIETEEGSKLRKSAAMLILAITAHNIPEGMSVGLAFSLAAQYPQDEALLSGAIALAVGIAIQNFPEGTAVALPLVKDGMSRKKAFAIAGMTAVVEPVFGVLAAVFAAVVRSSMASLLAFAAGTMIYVVVEELIPQAHMGEEGKTGTLGFVVGFLVMMILDVGLG